MKQAIKQVKTSAILFAWLMILSASTGAGTPFIQPRLTVKHSETQVVLTGNLNFSLSKEALDAIDNGLPLSMTTELKIVNPSKWFLDDTVWSASYHQQIQYHALSQQYLVKNMQSDYAKAFLTKSAALAALGRISDLSLTEKVKFHAAKKYELKVRSRIDINALPTPLRPLAYLSDGWKLRSEWKIWPIK